MKFSLKKRINSFRFAFQGLAYAIHTQHNLWIHITAAIVVVVLGFVFSLSIAEWLFVIFAIGFVITAELFNTSVEKLTDKVIPEKNTQARIIKDVAAAAVFIASLTALIIGLLIFIPKIFC